MLIWVGEEAGEANDHTALRAFDFVPDLFLK